MRFDDRLNTILGQQPADAHERAVRWRQLVELLARAGEDRGPLIQQALEEARRDAPAVDERARAASARAIARPELPAQLVALFAEDKIAVSAPVLAVAQLSADEWQRVLERATSEARSFVRALHPELGRSGRPQPPQPPATPPPASDTGEQARGSGQASQPEELPSISELVARIERLRQQRAEPAAGPSSAQDAPRAAGQSGPSGGSGALFRWECGPSGEIAWVEGVPRGALIGRSLAAPGEHYGAQASVRRAFANRAPFRDASLSISGEGVAAGEWKLSGVPAFQPSDGRFAGYRGIATRSGHPGSAAARQPGAALDHDSLRELVHELKTPLNAIIGFAEIIDGQYLGPADHSHRERAAEIVAQARLLLSAIEDLDLAAQLRSSAVGAGGSSDLRQLVAHASADLVERAGRHGARILLDLPPEPILCAVDQDLAERMVRRFCGSIIDAAAQGERLSLALGADAQRCLLSLDRPAGLPEIGARDGSLVEGRAPARLAAGLSLRLVGALARVVGGDLVQSEERVTLALPRAQ